MFPAYILAALFGLSIALIPLLPKCVIPWFICNVLGRLLFLRGTVEGTDIYFKFKNTHDKGIIIFSHPTFYDIVPICHVLQDMPRWVTKIEYIMGPLKAVVKRLGIITVDSKKKGTTAVICDSINKREKGDDLICICPAGTTSLSQEDIPPYKRGAFLMMTPILPVVMYYSSLTVWDKQTFFQMIYERVNGPILYYHCKVMEPLYPLQDETEKDYTERTRLYVRQGVLQCKDKASDYVDKESDIIKNLLIELLMVILIILLERNVFAFMITCYLMLRRCMDKTPQYELVSWIYIASLVIKLLVI